MKPSRFMGLFAVVLAGIIGLASSATEIVIPLLPLAAVPYVIGAGLGAAGLATLKTSAVAGAYLYLRKRGAIDLNLEVNKKEADGSYSQVYAIGKPSISDGSEIIDTYEAGSSDRYNYLQSRQKKHQQSHHDHHQHEQHNHLQHHQRPSPHRQLSLAQKLVSEAKKQNCGLRLMCELATIPQEQLAEDEKLYLSLHGGEEKLRRVENDSEEKSMPTHAYLIGKLAGNDEEVCSQVFYGCPLDRKGLMKNWRDWVL